MATRTHTTPQINEDRRATAGALLPPPAALGRYITALSDRSMALTEAETSLPKSAYARKNELNRTEKVVAAREDALRDLICAVPAQDLPDAAAQLCEAVRVLDYIDGFDVPEFDRNVMLRKVRRAVLSTLGVISAGEEFDWLGIAGDYIANEVHSAFLGVDGEGGA